jgi:hypothetical protein
VRIITALFLVAGCGSPPQMTPPVTPLDPPPPAPSPTATLEILGVTDGQDVTLVAGAQGGFHVWLSYATSGMPAGAATLLRTANRVEDDALVLRMQGQAMPEATDPIPMFMCPSPIGLSVIDRPIRFRLEFTDEKAAAEVTLTPHCPTDSSNAFCMRICTG